MKRIFEPKEDEVTGEWRRLHTEELLALHSSPNIIRMIKSRSMRWAGHVARNEYGIGTHRVVVGRHAGRLHRWEDNIKVDLQEMG